MKMIMRKRSHRRFLHHILFASVLLFLLATTVLAISATDDLTASARVTQDHINRLRAEKREYERQKRDIQAKIDSIEYDRMAEMAKKTVLDQRIELTALELKNVNETIETLGILVRDKEYEVIIAMNSEEAFLQKYKSRVRDMEENGIISYLEIIFDSTSFSDLLARIDFVMDIMRADETTYKAFQTARENTIAAKETLEEARIELEDEHTQLELLNEELIEQLDEAHAIILALEADIENESLLRDRYAAEEARVQREINAAVAALQKQQEEEERLRKEAQQNSSGSSSSSGSGSSGSNTSSSGGTGKLGWPINGQIVSRYGPRNGRFHLGLDIGAAHGVDIFAADSGTVITAKYNEGGLGYYVVISHGNGITTLYGHLSSYIVSVGDNVAKGQVIGYNGSTGNATTPHIHFEVQVNGTHVDPLTLL